MLILLVQALLKKFLCLTAQKCKQLQRNIFGNNAIATRKLSATSHVGGGSTAQQNVIYPDQFLVL